MPDSISLVGGIGRVTSGLESGDKGLSLHGSNNGDGVVESRGVQVDGPGVPTGSGVSE